MEFQTIGPCECESFSDGLYNLFLGEDSPLAVNHTQDHPIARVVKGVLAGLALIPAIVNLVAQRPIVFANCKGRSSDSRVLHIALNILRGITLLVAAPFLLVLYCLCTLGEWLSSPGYAAYEQIKEFVEDETLTNEMINDWCRDVETKDDSVCKQINLSGSSDWYLIADRNAEPLLVKRNNDRCTTVGLWEGQSQEKTLKWLNAKLITSQQTELSEIYL